MGTKENPGNFDCYHEAAPNEPLFVLLGRDPVAPLLVAMWIELRRAIGDGNLDKLNEAEACCDHMLNYLLHPDRPKKGEFTRKELLAKAVIAMRNEFPRMAIKAAPEHLKMSMQVASDYYYELKTLIRNNTGLQERARSQAAHLFEQGHCLESARVWTAKNVDGGVVAVYLAELDHVSLNWKTLKP